MSTIINIPKRFTLYAAVTVMAALVITLLAVTLTAGPTMAQGDDGSGPRTGDNEKQYDPPIPCSEEVEPDDDTERLIDDGYYAVFEGFWDYEVGHLSNNFCPPEVGVTTEDEETVYTRSNANTHISKTVFSFPESYKVTVVDSGVPNGNPSSATEPKIDLASYPFLRGAVSAVAEDGTFAGNSLYWVKADGTSPLQIGFSTALMDEADWYLKDGPDKDTEPDPPVQFRFSAVHVLQDGTPEEAHVLGAHMFAFDPGASQALPVWSNVETDIRSELDMQTGQYRPMQFVFTKPGVYLVQAQVQGHVRTKDDPAPADPPEKWRPVNSDESITSPVQWYNFHVGPEADLDVNITAGAVSSSTVPVTVTANNSGPDGAENVEVEISLPAGLSAPATLPAGATSNGCGVIAWEIGDMASSASPTLSFNATVDTGASGKVTARAEIRSTTFDSDAADNTASAEATLSGANVRPPYFPGVSRTIVEHAAAGAHAGDPVAAASPDGRVLSYSLSGRCSDKFEAHPNGQIVLAAGHTLDYEEQWEYPLTLHVSDGVNADGGADTSADDSMPVTVRVQDTDPKLQNLHPTVTFELTLNNSDAPVTGDLVADGTTYWLRTTLHNPPQGATLTYDWDEQGTYNPNWYNRGHTSYNPVAETEPVSRTYIVHIKWPGGGISASHTVTFVAAP